MNKPQDPNTPVTSDTPNETASPRSCAREGKKTSRCGRHRRHPHGRFLAGLFLLLGVGAVAASITGCHHHSPAHRLANRLDLTEAQEAQAVHLGEDIRAAFAPLHDKREAIYADVLAAVGSETLDQEVLKSRLAEVLRDVEQAATESIELAAELHATLSPEQRAELVETVEDLHAMHGRCRKH